VKRSVHTAIILFVATLALTSPGRGQHAAGNEPRLMEHLGRGLVAIHQGDGKVFVSWRLLGADPDEVAFNLYRASDHEPPVRINQEPLTKATCFIDESANLSHPISYFVRPLLKGTEQEASEPFVLPANLPALPYLSVPLQTPERYTPNDASVGDLDGDGEYEIVLHQVGRGRDNGQSGMTTEPILEAYKLDGTLLWRINLGKNIREGAHYTQFMVYDLDGDGRAEVACKTADGTIDGQGKTLGDAQADHRNARGYVLEGPEFLTIFDGLSGAASATTEYIPPRGQVREWGDDYGNRVDRFLACVAYLDGQHPSLIMCRGYYTRAVLAAWDFREGKLVSRWVFDTDNGTPGHRDYRGQGNHNLAVADVDGDGRDEIVYGSCVIDDNGQGLFSTRLGHGDALHVGDLDPARPGLEVWGIHENERGIPDKAGTALFNARTGEIYFTGSIGQDVGRGMAADIDPRHFGAEFWGGSDGLRNAKGERIGRAPRSVNMAIWWDGDLLRELLDGVNISKWDHENSQEVRLLSGRDFGVASNNGTKANPCLSADILGDWREELIARTFDGRELRIFTTTIPTEHRFPTLMHDPHYRLSVAWQNVAYNQPPHTGFYFGHEMSPPPRPAIRTVPALPLQSR
jgi:rhamnogalacturonan endolyase